jgi:diadenosine tetraphosphate (Ap4A) HIT family hydrolase
MCWLCNDYKEVGPATRRVNRFVFEDPNSYVIVPRESHVPHHLLVVLRKHKEGLIDCSADDLAHIGKTLASACEAFKSMGYGRVYGGCFSDEGHVHYHLIPFNMGIDKGYSGLAMHWLAEKERLSDSHPFDGMTDLEQQRRLDQIEIAVAEVRAKWPTNSSTGSPKNPAPGEL